MCRLLPVHRRAQWPSDDRITTKTCALGLTPSERIDEILSVEHLDEKIVGTLEDSCGDLANLLLRGRTHHKAAVRQAFQPAEGKAITTHSASTFCVSEYVNGCGRIDNEEARTQPYAMPGDALQMFTLA